LLLVGWSHVVLDGFSTLYPLHSSVEPTWLQLTSLFASCRES